MREEGGDKIQSQAEMSKEVRNEERKKKEGSKTCKIKKRKEVCVCVSGGGVKKRQPKMQTYLKRI